jgi:hypothetical protein
VADSECEATPVGDLYDYDDLDMDEEAPPVILSGKMTLSVINLPEAIAAEAAAAAAAAASVSKYGLLAVFFSGFVFGVANPDVFFQFDGMKSSLILFHKQTHQVWLKMCASFWQP